MIQWTMMCVLVPLLHQLELIKHNNPLYIPEWKMLTTAMRRLCFYHIGYVPGIRNFLHFLNFHVGLENITWYYVFFVHFYGGWHFKNWGKRVFKKLTASYEIERRKFSNSHFPFGNCQSYCQLFIQPSLLRCIFVIEQFTLHCEI